MIKTLEQVQAHETINKKEIYEDLLKAFVGYQHRLEHPMPKPGETEDFVWMRYQSEQIFRCRVDSLVSGVMHILEKHI